MLSNLAKTTQLACSEAMIRTLQLGSKSQTFNHFKNRNRSRGKLSLSDKVLSLRIPGVLEKIPELQNSPKYGKVLQKSNKWFPIDT